MSYTETFNLSITSRIPGITLLSLKNEYTYFSNTQKESLRDLGGPKRGFHVHTMLLLDTEQEKTIGLIAQKRWCQDITERGKKAHRRVRLYAKKESYQWEKIR